MNFSVAVLALLFLQDPAPAAPLGVPPADESVTLDLAVRVRADGKDAPPVRYETGLRIVYTPRRADGVLRLDGRVAQLSFAGDLGEGRIDLRWDETRKIDETDWKAAPALRGLAADGFSIDLDAAGNVVRCSSAVARQLVFGMEPMLAGAAGWMPGSAKAAGERWEASFVTPEVDAELVQRIESEEAGTIVIGSSISFRDRLSKDSPAGSGRGATRIDRATGRVGGSTLTLEMKDKAGSMQVEIDARIAATKRP